jgi:hypothetical protein
MTNWDHHASASPEINDIAKGLLQHPTDTLLHLPAQLADNGSPTVSDGAHPAHPHFDGNQSVGFKFADDGSSHPGPVPHDPPPLAALSSDLSEDHSAHSFKPNSDHHASADREISDVAKDNLPQHAADNLPHGPAQHADNGPPAVTEGAHPAHPHSDGNQPANPKFADDGSAHPGNGSPAVTDGAHPAHPHFDANQPANPKFADDGSAHPGKVPHDPPTALSSDLSGEPAHPFKPNSDHHASADREISDVAKDNLPQHAADNLPHGPAQHADNGPPAVTEGAHPAHPHFDNFKFADDDSAHLVSGEHGPAAPALAKTFDGPDPGSDQFIFGKSFDHEPPADLKSDVPEIDHAKNDEIQELLDIAHHSNPVSPLDPTHAPAPQDMTKVQVPHQGDFHFA